MLGGGVARTHEPFPDLPKQIARDKLTASKCIAVFLVLMAVFYGISALVLSGRLFKMTTAR